MGMPTEPGRSVPLTLPRARRILIAHNRYVSANPSGENEVVAQQAELLAKAGVEVELFQADSDDLIGLSPWQRARLATAPLVGSDRLGRLDELVGHFRPDVVHLHNPYPLISPRLLHVAHRHGVPIVQTVHNYRHRCMNGLLFRDGTTCTSCEGRLGPLPGVLHGCYRDSYPQSVVMGAALTVHRRTWPKFDRFVAVSPFVADRLTSWGVPPDQVRVVANPVVDPGEPEAGGSGLLFAGRLSVEKGIDLLLDAWAASGCGTAGQELVVAGSGPLGAHVQDRVATLDRVRLLGQLSRAELADWRRRTRASVLSSECFETLTSAGESFAAGRPVLTIDHGVQATVVDHTVGWVQPPTVAGLADGLRTALAATPEVVATLGAAARQRWHDTYRPEVVVAELLAVYAELQAL